MIRKKWLNQWFVCLFLIVIIAGCIKKNPIVARVGKKSIITFNELKEYYDERNRGKDIKLESLEDIKGYLNRMINRKIMILEAYKNRLEQDSVVIEGADKTKRQLMMQKLFNIEIVDNVFPESIIRDYYARTGKEFMLRLIALKIPRSENGEEKEKIKAKGEEILARLRAGENFTELVDEYSEDRTTKNKGGLGGPFVWDRPNDPIMEKAYLMKEGEISDLIEKNNKYYIIRVEEIREKKREPYRNEREKILTELQKENQSMINKAIEKFSENLKQKKALTWNEQTLDTLTNRFKDVGVMSKGPLLDSLIQFSHDDEVLVSYRGGAFTIEDLRKRMDVGMPPRARFEFGDKERLKRLIFNNMLFEDFLVEIAYGKELDKDRFVRNGVMRRMETEMVNQLKNKVIFAGIEPSEEEILDHYQKYKNDRFAIPGKVQIQEVLVKEKELSEKIYRWVKEGKDIGKLAQKYTTRAGYKRKKGVFVPFTERKWGKLGKAAFALEEGQIGGPIKLEKNLGYSIFKVLDKTPNKIKPFEKVKSRVRNNLISEMRDEKETAWLDEKWKEYQVEVYDEVIKKMIENDE